MRSYSANQYFLASFIRRYPLPLTSMTAPVAASAASVRGRRRRKRRDPTHRWSRSQYCGGGKAGKLLMCERLWGRKTTLRVQQNVPLVDLASFLAYYLICFTKFFCNFFHAGWKNSSSSGQSEWSLGSPGATDKSWSTREQERQSILL